MGIGGTDRPLTWTGAQRGSPMRERTSRPMGPETGAPQAPRRRASYGRRMAERSSRRPFRRSGDSFDLVVIGMGSAGVIAAEIAGHDLGLRVAAVERARLGGDCLWTGCVPSKALVASAKTAHTVRNAAIHGVEPGEFVVDLEAVWRRVGAIRSEIAFKRAQRFLWAASWKLLGRFATQVNDAGALGRLDGLRRCVVYWVRRRL